MKLAISGKGGVGKTMLAALLAREFAQAGYAVTAIDADPDANLGLTLGFSDYDKITPIAEISSFIEEHAETGSGQSGSLFNLSPRVDDIPSEYAKTQDGIRLLAMGRPRAGGAGCYCPENAVLAALIAHLLLSPSEVVIMDMAAGIEHLNRGTARAVDKLIIVAEPGRASLETARRIIALAGSLGLTDISLVGNKVGSVAEEKFIRAAFPGCDILGFLPYDESLIRAELAGKPKLDASPAISASAREIMKKLVVTA